MAGAINFAMSDIYGGVFGTTELTVPEADDQNTLVDDQKVTSDVSEAGKKKFPMLLAVVLIFVLVFVFGGGVR